MKGNIQNPNESLHALVWSRCPKEQSVGPQTVECAVQLAVIRFNEGAVALKGVLENMGIQSGKFMSKALHLKDRERLYHASKKHSETGKQRRKQVKRLRKGYEYNKRKAEGDTYVAGGFDA